jgi:ketosteroid isomerase-like protein
MTRTLRTLALTCVLAVSALSAGAQQPTQPAAPAPAPQPSVTLPPELDRVLRDYEKEWSAGNAAGLAQLFTADGFVMNSGRPAIRGTEDVTALYKTTSGSPLSLRAFAYATSDTVGYIVGGFARDKNSPDGGKFILLLRRTGRGPWKIAADMDNANRRMGG